jgi:hypothetical protein
MMVRGDLDKTIVRSKTARGGRRGLFLFQTTCIWKIPMVVAKPNSEWNPQGFPMHRLPWWP